MNRRPNRRPKPSYALAMAFAAAGWFGATAGGCGPELEDEATAAVGATTGAGGGAAVDEVNGCTLSEAEDQRGETEVVISFGGALGNVYDPQCVLVDAGTIIRFVGDFDFHPLRGGVSGAEDPGSDIPAVTPEPRRPRSWTLRVTIRTSAPSTPASGWQASSTRSDGSAQRRPLGT